MKGLIWIFVILCFLLQSNADVLPLNVGIVLLRLRNNWIDWNELDYE